jgi:hypothetical protein
MKKVLVFLLLHYHSRTTFKRRGEHTAYMVKVYFLVAKLNTSGVFALLLPLDLKSVNIFYTNNENSSILNIPFHILGSITNLLKGEIVFFSNSIAVELVCCLADKLS